MQSSWCKAPYGRRQKTLYSHLRVAVLLGEAVAQQPMQQGTVLLGSYMFYMLHYCGCADHSVLSEAWAVPPQKVVPGCPDLQHQL